MNSTHEAERWAVLRKPVSILQFRVAARVATLAAAAAMMGRAASEAVETILEEALAIQAEG